MITELNTIKVGSAGGAEFHYFMKSNFGLAPEDPGYNDEFNDNVELAFGDSKDLYVWEAHAKSLGRKVSILDIGFMPNGELTDAQWDRAREIADEVLGDIGDHDSSFVFHDKRRGDDSNFRHAHFLKNMINPFTGRSVDTRNLGIKAQVVSRLCEYEFGLDPTPGSRDRVVVDWIRGMGHDQAANDIEHNLEQARALKLEMENRNKPAPDAKPIKSATYKNSDLKFAERHGVKLPLIWNRLRATHNDPAAVGQVLCDLEGQGFNVIKGNKGNIVLIEKGGWRKSLGRLAGLDDDADFYSAFLETKEIRENDRAEDSNGRRVSEPEVTNDTETGASALRGVDFDASNGRRRDRYETVGPDRSVDWPDSAGRGSGRGRTAQDDASPGDYRADQHGARGALSAFSGPHRSTGVVTGLHKLRRAEAAASVSGRLDAVFAKLTRKPGITGLQKLRRHAAATAVSGRISKILDRLVDKRPTGLHKLRRAEAAASVSGRLDAVFAQMIRKPGVTGLQKLRRQDSAAAVSGRLDAVLSNFSAHRSSSAPPAIYFNDNDPNAWKVRLQQWSESMKQNHTAQGP